MEVVDSVAKIEKEKCGLDMSAYEDLPRPSVGGSDNGSGNGGGGGGECNGDNKDDYVFVNGSDAGSEDHGERDGNGEINGSESNVDSHEKVEEGDDVKVNEDDLVENHAEESDKVNNEIEVDSGESKAGNEVNVGTESESKIEGGELVMENGDNKSQSEVVVEGEEVAVENGGGNNIEGEVDDKVRDSGVVEGNNATFVSDGNKDGESESHIEKLDDCHLSVGGDTTPVVGDDDDKDKIPLLLDGGSDARSPDEAGLQNGNAVTDAISLAPDGYTEEQQHLEEPQRHEDQDDKSETSKSEAGKPQVVEDNVQPHVDEVEVRQMDPLHSSEKELKPLEVDIVHQSETGASKMQPSDNENWGTHQIVDGEDNGQPHTDEVEVRDLEPLDSSAMEPKPVEADIGHQLRDNGVPEIQPSDNENRGPHQIVDGEDNGQPHTDEVEIRDLEPLDSSAMEPKPVEADIGHQLLDNGVPEIQASDSEFQGPHLRDSSEPQPEDGEAKESLLGDADTVNQPLDCVKPELQTTDWESKELGSVEAETEVKEQGDPDEVARNQDLSSVDSKAATSEVPQTEKGETMVLNGTISTTESEEVRELDTVPMQSDGPETENCLVSTPLEVENSVSDSTEHADVSKIELGAEVEKSDTTLLADMQSDTRDKPVVDCETKRVDGQDESELIAEASQESSVQEDVHLDQVVEETGSVNVVGNKVSLEDLGLEKTMAREEAPTLSNLQVANGAAADDHGDDLSGVVASENQVSDDLKNHSENASLSGETSAEAEGCLRAEEGDLSIPVDNAADLPVSSDQVNINEQGVDSASCVADNSLICSAGDTSPLPKVESGNSSYIVPDAGLQIRDASGDVDAAKNSNIPDNTIKPKISFGSFECEAPFSHNEVNPRPEVSSRSIKFTSSKPKVKPSSGVAMLNSEPNGVHPTGYSHDKIHAEDLSLERLNKDEVSASPLQGSGVDAFNGQTEVVRRPFYYLIRIPRYEEESLREKIRLAEIEVEEKTQSRDSVRVEYQKTKAIVNELKSSFQAAKAQERAARDLVMAKKRDMDSAQSLINLAKSAMTVEDVHSRILNMEHKIQHETLKLNEEKQLVREIKQMKILRDKLYADTRSQENLQQALDQRVEVEEHLKVLRKEMDALRDDLSKAEQSAKVARKKFDDKSILLNELYGQFTSADMIRQKAYEDLLTLRKQWSAKNKFFWSYKDDAKAANELVVAGDKDSLERHCVNQVEKIMELWNKNDEFRKEYIRCNTRSTLRRLRTLDGRALGQDEQPPLLANFSDGRVNSSAKVHSVVSISTKEPDMPSLAKSSVDNSSKKVMEQKNKTVPVKKMAEVTTKNNLAETTSNSRIASATSKNSLAAATSKNSFAEASGRTDVEDDKKKCTLTKEEEELARKAEQLRREEEAARLREQRRLEEKTKAQEALERKRRMAEKAKARAEFRAQKEAEQKEKEREKRAKKKEKKKGVTSDTVESEPVLLPESSSEKVREHEVTEKPMAVAKKPQKPSLYVKQIKTTKSIPPPLRNRSKRRIQQWTWVLAAVVGVLALFFLGNSKFFRNSRLLSFGPAF